MHRKAWIGAQFAFWALYGAARFLAILPAVTADERGAMLLANGVRALTGLLVTSGLWPVLRRAAHPGRPAWAAGVGAIILLAGVIGWPVVDRVLLVMIAGVSRIPIPWARFPRGIDLEYLIVLVAWSAAVGGLLLLARARVAREALLAARVATRDAQLRALAAQLNPHFLFNSLNAIRGLILEDPERARTTLTRLSAFLRRALSVDAAQPVALEEEFRAVEDYLSIEKMRFESDLDVTIRLDPAVEDVLVPPLILQPVVENAVVHGRAGADGVRRIRIEARSAGPGVRIEVMNDGALAGSREGIGVDLTRSRLQQMYGPQQRFDLSQRDGCVLATIDIAAPRWRAPEPQVDGAR